MKLTSHTPKPDKDHPIVKFITDINTTLGSTNNNNWYYKNMYDLLLDAGIEMKNDPNISSVSDGLKLVSNLYFKPKMKECYYNSQVALLNCDKLDQFEYCEGFAMSENVPIPIQHGWLRHKKTKNVIDLTWQSEDVKSVPRKGCKYFGIVINKRDVMEGIMTGKCSSHLDGFWNGWTILERKFNNDVSYNLKVEKYAI